MQDQTNPAAQSPIIDIRLEQADAGWWCASRVKDATGWRDATNAEGNVAGISSPKWGYDKYPNGRYTQSGKYELIKSAGDVATFDTRQEARAALLAYLNSPEGAAKMQADTAKNAAIVADIMAKYGGESLQG